MKSKTVKSALTAMAVLLIISVVCVAILCLCNMFFPKYKPTLDSATAKLINGICDTGKSDGEAFDEGYIVLLAEDEYGVTLADYNKTNKKKNAEILAVYGEPSGLNAGAYIIESKSQGRDGDVIILVAYNKGTIVGATVKKQGESYWNKLPGNLFDLFTNKHVSENINLEGEIGSTGATKSLNAVNRAVNIANAFAYENGEMLRSTILEKSKEAGND